MNIEYCILQCCTCAILCRNISNSNAIWNTHHHYRLG